jgi:hypothetical protein
VLGKSANGNCASEIWPQFQLSGNGVLGPASAANRAATFKQLNRTRAEHPACPSRIPENARPI